MKMFKDRQDIKLGFYAAKNVGDQIEKINVIFIQCKKILENGKIHCILKNTFQKSIQPMPKYSLGMAEVEINFQRNNSSSF